MKLFFHLIIVHFFFIILTTPSWSQTKSQAIYVSPEDKNLAIKTVAVIPFTDNVGGIYARPLTEHIKALLQEDPQWQLSTKAIPAGITTEVIESRQADVQKILKATQSEAALWTKISKGPSGLALHFVLFVGQEGLPLVIEDVESFDGFDLGELKKEFSKIFSKLKFRMPYRGIVSSRRGQQVTINIGKDAGVKNGSDVSVIQILKINRHPRLKFMVGTEKEILGKIKIFKVDDHLSFGHIVLEREPGVILVGSKVMPDEYTKYEEPYFTSDGKILEDINNRKDKDISYGDKPQEWLPEQPPQYGKFAVSLGLGQYTQTASLQTAGSIAGSNGLVPNLDLQGEFWLNKEWYISLLLRQSAFNVANGLSGSSPGNINMSLGKYDVQFGRTFLLSEDFFGPKFQFGGSLAQFNSRADLSSPILYSNMSYGGIALNFLGEMPLGDLLPYTIGAKFKYYWTNSVSESVSSGDAGKPQITDFSFFGTYKKNSRMNYTGELNFEYYSSGFSGAGSRPDPASNISHKVTTFLLGLQYLF